MTKEVQTENKERSLKKYVCKDVVDHCLSILELGPDDKPKNDSDRRFSTNKEKLWDSLGELFFIFLVYPPSMGPNKKTKNEFDKTLSALKNLVELLDRQVPEPPFKEEDFNSPNHRKMGMNEGWEWYFPLDVSGFKPGFLPEDTEDHEGVEDNIFLNVVPSENLIPTP